MKELYAYIWDTFDFDNEGYKYEQYREAKDGSIVALEQSVRAWDYKEIKFDFNHSARQMSKYREIVRRYVEYQVL